MTSFANIPAGYYAVTGKDGTTVRFFKVKVRKYGEREYRFIDELVAQGGFTKDELREVRLNKEFGTKLLAYIATHPAKFSQAFGHALGVCGVCGRTLTDDQSIAAGIGPICAGKF